MQFVDKAINRALKWENHDVSIQEMLYLIQMQILEKCSSNDLQKLRKGMNKTWVLAIGNGFSQRFYPSSDSPVRLYCQFHLLTHQLKQISLQDTVNKKEYFIPSGKEESIRLQQAVLSMMAGYFPNNIGRGLKNQSCGRFLNSTQSTRAPRRIHPTVLALIAVAAVSLGVLCLPSTRQWVSDHFFSQSPEWVSTVKNGYLGEFTDVTVYEMLSSYRIFYEDEVWDGGTTNTGKQITQVRFTSPQSDDSTTIQFQMLNDEVFKVSAFVDTMQPNAQNSDILYMLNLMYYSEAGMNYLLEDAKVEQLCALMRTVDANEVTYGAAAGYTGDRSALFKFDGGSLMGLSAAELMEHYGTSLSDTPPHYALDITLPPEESTKMTIPETEDEDLECFSVDSLLDDLNNDAARAKVKYKDRTIELIGLLDGFSNDGKTFTLRNVLLDYPQKVTCSVPKNMQASALSMANYGDYVTIRGQVTQVEQSVGYTVQTLEIVEIAENPDNRQEEAAAPETLTGTVKRSSGELRVRSGPGTNYAEICRLNAGTVVTIYEQQNVNGTYWGNIGDGWICMDYVDLGPQQSLPAGGSSTSVNMTVCVKLSAGELRIRSGPDTSYSEVGRLYGGEILTVTELQQTGGTQWGRIPQGWICMDYVDTVYGTQEVQNNAFRFTGNWIENSNANKQCRMTIQTAENGSYLIEMQLSLTAAESKHWYTMAEYDENQDCITYSLCKCWISTSDGNGSFSENVQYYDGQGRLYFSNGYLYWKDFTSSMGPRPFVPA